MVVGEIAESVDLLIVGGGPGGYVAALRAAGLGAEVVLVERGGPPALGGTCLHGGGIPGRALFELSRRRDQALGSAVGGLTIEGIRVDMAAFQAYRAGLVDRQAAEVGRLLRARGVRVLAGEAFFNRPTRVAVRHQDRVTFLDFDRAVIATGGRPRPVPGLAFDGSRVVDTTGALGLEEVPRRLLIVGGGHAGVELGMAFAKLGSAVTIVESGERLLSGFSADLVSPVLRTLRRLGVKVFTGSTVATDRTVASDSTAHHVQGDVLTVMTPQGPIEVGADVVVVAAGRAPATEDIGLHLADVPVDPGGYVRVDAQCLVRAGLAAVGDVTTGPVLAQKAMAQALVAAEALCGLPSRYDPYAVPMVVHADPEIATVGLTAEQASAGGLRTRTAVFPIAGLLHTAAVDHPDGFARLVVDTDEDRIIGVEIVAPNAADLIGEAALAVEMAASPADIARTIHPHPTFAEAVQEAAFVAAGTPLHDAGSPTEPTNHSDNTRTGHGLGLRHRPAV